MLKPSGGFFKKMFSPDKMAKTTKKAAPAPTARTAMTGAQPRKMGGPLNKAVGRKAAY